jgi:hypothetical protein
MIPKTNVSKPSTTGLPLRAETLSNSHRRMLYEESGISPAVAAERGYFTARTRSEVPAVFKPYQRRSGLVIPLCSPDGVTRSYQLRPDKPRKGGPKYESPGGSEVIVDVHPAMLEEVRTGNGPLFVVEGTKKGDALASRGIPTIALSGVWMWCVPKVKPYRLKPCFDHVRLEGREVFVAFDSDCMSKAGVQDALKALVEALEARGAKVRVIYLQDAPDGRKQGADDFYAAGGSVEEMFMLAREFSPVDIARVRLSKDARLRAVVEDLERRFWSAEWKGVGGHSARDVALKLVEEARRSGKVRPDGLRVVKAQGPLALESKVSSRTLWKSLNRLEEMGFGYRDNSGRKADKTGAFVLIASGRANVSHYGETATQATQELQTCDAGDLHLRAPRLMWSRPKFTPKRGTVTGTRRVRESKAGEPRDRITRLGKIRGAVLDALDVAGGSATLQEIADVLHRKRARDIRRRSLPMLEEFGILTVEEDRVTLAANWLDRLEEAREIGGELEAEQLARRRYRDKSRAYHNRDKPPVSKPSAAGLEAVRRSREKSREHRRTHLVGWVEEKPPELSPLAVAVRAYLERNPRDARQPLGWIGSTLWAYELYPGKPTPEQTRTAIEEIGGSAYLEGKLKKLKGAA